MLNESNSIVSATDGVYPDMFFIIGNCWGYPLDGRSYQSDNTDYKFTGKQRDTETGWDYFGARYYDARIARWGGVEPLLEKYLSFTPYQYGLLNPTKYVDPKGKDVRATSDDAQQTILNTLLKNIRSYIKFDDNGNIVKDGLDKIICNSENFKALMQLVNDTRLYEVNILEKFDYKRSNGIFDTQDFGPVGIYAPEEFTEYTPSTGENGYTGTTLIPGNSDFYNSRDDVIRININARLSCEGMVQIFAHEAYGHAYFYSLGKENYGHEIKNNNGKDSDQNEELKQYIIARMLEAKINLEEK